jgi:AraC-like DNA-binding protein
MSTIKKGLVYRHADLVADGVAPMIPGIDGFSVICNDPMIEQDMFKKHFRSDFLAIFLINAGEMSLRIDLKEYTLGPGNIIIVAPNSVKQILRTSSHGRISAVSFTAGFLGKMGMSQKGTDLLEYFTSKYSPFWKLTKKDTALVVALIKQLQARNAMLQNVVFGKELLFHTFYIFLYEMKLLSIKYTKVISPNLSRKETLVMNFVKILQQQFRTMRNVQQYARQLFVSPKYLTETVKEITGKNAGEIIDDFVVLEAKILLDDTSLSVANIADILHFSDQAFFSKFFKRHTGLSPKKYRDIPQ